MNLRTIANRATRRINPNETATLLTCTGYTTKPDGEQVPGYASPAIITIQAQALTKEEVEHLDAMNLSSAKRAVYANVQLTPVDREKKTGGDLLAFEGAKWLVVALLEGWNTAGWCKVALVRQAG